MSSHATLTRTVAEWIVRQSATALPDDMNHHVRRMLLDHLAGVAASSVGEVSAAAKHGHKR